LLTRVVVAVVEGSKDARVVLVYPLFCFGLNSELTGGDEVEIYAWRREGGREGGRVRGREGGKERSGVLTFALQVLEDGEGFRDRWELLLYSEW